MILPRVIPCLLLRNTGLVKTVCFKNPVYVGDPRNAVKIFNEREVDELVLLDIQATPQNASIQYDLIREIATEAFMPVGYGGHITNVEQARRLVTSGIEKIILCTAAVQNPDLVTDLSHLVGSSSTVVCIDYKRNFWGRNEVYIHGGRKGTGLDPVEFASEMERRGAGELMLNSIDRDGTMQGYDLDLLRVITHNMDIPVIACGGAGKLDDFHQAVQAGASAVSAGSMFVFQGRHRAVLISYPSRNELRRTFENVMEQG
jgi:imidazole glycerol-phosphate synthase subunit HisF